MSEALVQVSRIIAASPTKVWQALTSPEKLKQYFFGADVQSSWRVGSPIRSRGEFNGEPYEDKGEIRTFDPQYRLAFSHYSPRSGAPDTPESYNLLTFDLEPNGGQTKVTLTQDKLEGAPRPDELRRRREYKKNWTILLDGLEKTLARRPRADQPG